MLLDISGISRKINDGLEVLKDELNLKFSLDGVKLNAIKGDVFSVDFDGKTLNVTYKYETEVYRAIAMVIANNQNPLKKQGNRYFKNFGVHTVTRYYVPNVSTLKKLLRKLALLGYSEFQMYMHSNFEIDCELYFGYAGGKYSQEELKEIANYGETLGVNVIPCLETLAHQPELKRWSVYQKLYDWDDILNPGKEETYALIEKMIATCAKCFNSKVINLGMDEAYMLGHGFYFREHGFKDRVEIFLQHLSMVVDIAKKYGYTEQIIWSDMLYTSFNDNYYYWGENQLPKNVIDRIPDSVTLAYWDYYGTDNDHYNWCMKNHMRTGKKVLFAGGAWNWNGTLTHNRFSIEILKMAFGYCKNNGVDNLLITSWGKGPVLQLLPTFCFASAYAYGETDDEEKSLFKVVSGYELDDFMLLDCPNYVTQDQCYVTPVAEQTLYNDYFIGLYDGEVFERKSGIWLEHIKALEFAKNKCKDYELSFDKCIALCKICYHKYELGLKTRKAYRTNDKETLSLLIETEYIPLIKLYEDYFEKREKEWKLLYKTTGFEVEIMELGTMIQRTKYCINELNSFINGEISNIDELDADILDLKGNGKNLVKNGHYSVDGFKNIFAPSVWC